MSKIITRQKSQQPFKSSLISLVAVGFMAGFSTVAAFWVLNSLSGLASIMFSIVLMFMAFTFLIIALRIYASISLHLAQNDQKHIKNAIIQAKDMLDTSKKLRDEHVLVQSMTQNIPFPMWLKDRFGRYLVCNQAFTTQWCNGIDPIGKTDAELLNNQLVEAFTEADLTALRTGVPQKLDLKLEITNALPKWVRIERYSLVGDDQEPVGILGFAFDISDYKIDTLNEQNPRIGTVTEKSNELD